MPRRVLVKKLGDDLFGDDDELKPVSSISAHGASGHRYPNLPWQGVNYELKNIVLTEHGGRYVIDQCESKLEVVYQGDVRYLRKVKMQYSDYNFSPDPQDTERTMTIPEGTRVGLENDSQIACVWRDGDVRRQYDGELVRTLADLTFAPPRSAHWGWLLLANGIVLMLVAIAIVVSRRRSAQQ